MTTHFCGALMKAAGEVRAMTINSHYNSAPPGSLPVKIATNQRRKMFAAFVGNTGVSADDTVLDVGATSDHSFENSNYFEAWFPHKRQLTAVGVDDASFLAVAYPGLTFIRADGRRLPFKDASFDFVHSNAVLEHGRQSGAADDFPARGLARGAQRRVRYYAKPLVSGRVPHRAASRSLAAGAVFSQHPENVGNGFFCPRGEPQLVVAARPREAGSSGRDRALRHSCRIAARLADQPAAVCDEAGEIMAAEGTTWAIP